MKFCFQTKIYCCLQYFIVLFFAGQCNATPVKNLIYEPFAKNPRKLKQLSAPSEIGKVKKVPQHRIYRGYSCTSKHFLYLVAILQEIPGKTRSAICGGSLITRKLVLTAAHCVKEDIFAGVLMETSHQQVISIESSYIHPNYNIKELKNDIGVLALAEYLQIEGVRTVKLPSDHSTNDMTKICNQKAFVMGWGKTDKLPAAATLQCVSLPIIHMSECQKMYGDLIEGMEQQVFCTLSKKGRDACTGDSGGPVLCNGIQIGVVSWGGECGEPENPGVFTRTDYYLTFINQVIRQDCRRHARGNDSTTGHSNYLSSNLYLILFLVIVLSL